MKQLRLENVCDMDTGNAFLPEFMKHYNERFSLTAVKGEDLHRRLNVQAPRLADILCHREQRHVGQQLSLAYDRRQIILERSDLADGLAGQYVEIYDFADRPLEVRWKGHLLPYRVFSKDQRVSHTAIVENKRLRHALATVKAQQDIKRLPKIQTNSEKNGYKKNPRRVYGPDYVPKPEVAPAVEIDSLMESEENIKPFPLFPSPWKSQVRRFHTFPPHRRLRVIRRSYTDISIRRPQRHSYRAPTRLLSDKDL